jgi:cytochrome b561
MPATLRYGTTAKVLHWAIVGLLVLQYAIGWLMPDVHRGPPGTPMVVHMSLGVLVFVIIVLRLGWRLTHPVAPESSLPPWQRLSSEAVHWLLYAMVLATTLSGWLFASFRGWSVRFFYLVPLPMLWSGDDAAVKAIDGLHQAMEWTLLALIAVHVLAALAHVFVYRDRIMQRMLPG